MLRQRDLRRVIAFGVVYNAARVSLSERSRELASLRVLGFTRAEISLILLGELAMLTLAALPVGWLFGYGSPRALIAPSRARSTAFRSGSSRAGMASASLGRRGRARLGADRPPPPRPARSDRRAQDAGVGMLVMFKHAGLIAVLVVVGALVPRRSGPTPPSVDVATAARGPLRVTIDEDGQTRVRDRFVVSAPVAGRVAAHRARARRSGGRAARRSWPRPAGAAPLLDRTHPVGADAGRGDGAGRRRAGAGRARARARPSLDRAADDRSAGSRRWRRRPRSRGTSSMPRQPAASRRAAASRPRRSPCARTAARAARSPARGW